MSKRIYREPSEETKIKMSEAKKGTKNINYGKQRSFETRQKISEKMIEYWKDIPSKHDKQLSENTPW